MADLRLADRIDVTDLPAGHHETLLLAAVRLGDGSTLQVPVRVAAGRKPGPTLTVVAGVHGDEPDGMAALLDLWDELPRLNLTGTLILVAVANPMAFGAHQRRSPIDGVDLNRVFPGNSVGTASERLADALYRLVTDNADFLFTLHSWYATGDCLPHVEFQDTQSKVRAESLAAAAACGFSRLRASNWHRGLLPRAATDAGIPSIEAEIGGTGRSRAPGRAQYRQHILNLMTHLGMLAGSVAPVADAHVGRSIDVASPAGGILRNAVQLGDYVVAGQLIATVTDLAGDRSIAVHTDRAGVILAIRQYLSTSPGDLLFRIFEKIEMI